ncbi:MAG: hypothetical protein FWG59_01545 [Betaproteobacteria bacterium]|nr:hypothetical protein [Betaproteobacteria bacterium]
MLTGWKNAFFYDSFPWKDENSFSDIVVIDNLGALKLFLDSVHIKFCLLKPYFENGEAYPLVEARELLPSFDSDAWEYKELPGFSLVAFARPLSYFSEIFQYDILYPAQDGTLAVGDSCPLEKHVITGNVNTVTARLPKIFQDEFRQRFEALDASVLDYYPLLLPYLLEMDRAHVIAFDLTNHFHLAGINASFPCDIDGELKRYGMRIGKFIPGDNDSYERNRMFVYQHLMELYGFPVVSERRTASALFARKLHRMGEHFLLRVMGQSDRTITTYTYQGGSSHFPLVEKIALCRVDEDLEDAIEAIGEGGFFVDQTRRVVIIRITYQQHRFNPHNLRQERALSVVRQEIIHPLNGTVLSDINIVKDSTNMFLRFNDIVRGEYKGKTVYKRTELVENTDSDDNRLKFLYSWLSKHQRRITGYSDEFFAKLSTVLSEYLLSPERDERFEQLKELRQEVLARFNYIQQARKIRLLEELRHRQLRGARIGYLRMLEESVALLQELRFEIVNYFSQLVDTAILHCEAMLNDRYLVKTYIECPDERLSKAGLAVRKKYGQLVLLLDEFKAIRKTRQAV